MSIFRSLRPLYVPLRRYAVQRTLPRDPESAVRIAHEKERFAYKYAVREGDFSAAYKIYIEQRDVPYLSGADVTAMAQLIAADAVRRDVFKLDQPQSIKDVLWTIIEDVRENKVPGQTMLWAYALESLRVWRQDEQVEELWSWLKTLPNRTEANYTAHCIDSRVYGQYILAKSQADAPLSQLYQLYDEVKERGLANSHILRQAMIVSLIKKDRLDEANKIIDEAISDHRKRRDAPLRPQFFTAILVAALDRRDLTAALEIFHKACGVNAPPGSSQVVRLISELVTAMQSLSVVMQVYEQYRDKLGSFPIHIVNSVVSAIFATSHEGVPTKDILERIHALISQCRKDGMNPNVTTVNILLGGYTELGEAGLVDDLMKRIELNENSFRSILKALKTRCASLEEIQTAWSRFVDFRKQSKSRFVTRDWQMLLRASFAAANNKEAIAWFIDILAVHGEQLDRSSWTTLNREVEQLQRSHSYKVPISDTGRYHDHVLDITYTNTPATVDTFLNTHSCAHYGFDLEHRPTFKPGQKANLALIQICPLSTTSSPAVLLFSLFHADGVLPDSLRQVLVSNDTYKYGVGVKSDTSHLRHLPIHHPSYIELGRLAYVKKRSDRSGAGLKALTEGILGPGVIAYKTKSLTMTNWEIKDLTTAQIKYAAMDAWCSMEIYRCLSQQSELSESV
ncbi:hypothetical protein MRB53_039199 [Persea americana]|nr:hypothetical protein MRB53_039199 [Persea americana]